MSIIPRGSTKAVKIVYPPGCKEVTDELGKDELVRRLKLIARAFQDMGQDDNEQFSGLALHLATDFFIEHTNKDVRLLSACCVADVFRIFAPEAPYRDSSHLKDIFMFLIKQLRGLEDPNSPTFKRYFYLLENLAWVKSFNICIELDDNQEIFCSLFKLMFSVINEKHTTKVKNFMLDMMSPLLTEADMVSQELLDILLINIVEPNKSQNRQAYGLAKELLVRTCNAIEPYVQAFFNNALMLGKTSESEMSGHLYDLIYELNAITPSVLLAVLPQLEFKLKSNEETERKSVTKILSKMFSDPGSNLAELNKPLWNCFLGRFNDISITVRTICVQSVINFVLHHPELVKDVIEQVKTRQHDAEETVRQEVVSSILGIAKKNFDVMSDEMLTIVKERMRDKKFKIRQIALLGLGQLYKAITTMENASQANLNKILWVKDKIFHAYYQQNPDDRLMVERLFNMCLVPYTLPVSERMKRLYHLYSSLDDPAVKVRFQMTVQTMIRVLLIWVFNVSKGHVHSFPTLAFNEMMKHRHMVRTCVQYVLDGLDKMLAKPQEHVVFLPKLQQIARTLPDPLKAMDQVKRFKDILANDKRMRTLMRYLVSPDCNCRKANETVREVLKKLGGGTPNSSAGEITMYNTIKSLLERVAPVMVDNQAIAVLVQHVDDAVKGQGTIADGIDRPGEKGVQLLLCLAGVFPQYFKGSDVFDVLITFLKDEDEIVSDTALQIFTLCGQNLEKEHPDLFGKLLPILQHTAKIGNPKQSKHAIRCISKIAKNKEAMLTPVFEHVKNNINPESANYITSIVALSHISQLCPEEFAQSMKAIVSKDIVKDLLMQDRTHGDQVMDSWYSDHLVTEETQAKIQAMKLLVRWLLGLKSNMNNSATSTLRLLYTIIVHEGDLMEKGLINKPELARLRLQAGCSMLKLMEEQVFADLLLREHFQALALLINDSCYHVRLKFAAKLHKGLYSLRLPLEFMAIFSLAANDPIRERRTCIKKFIQMNIQRRREYLKHNTGLGGKMFLYLPDYVMPYTIHLLAHDPDLKSYEDIQALKNIKECLWFIMEPLVARSEDYNYQFFRRLIENIKQAKDAQGAEDEDMNFKLYAVCDLALGLLQKNLTNVVLKESNIDPVLPSKLFTQLDKRNINATVYLPKDFNFDKKKIMSEMNPSQSSSQPSIYYRGRRQEQATLETIIVESPGPVVNPNPTCPREPKAAKPIKKIKAEDASAETSDTPATPETESIPRKGRSRARRGTRDNSVESEDKDSVEDTSQEPGVKSEGDTEEGTEDSSQESQETSEVGTDKGDTPSPPPKKRILKRRAGEEAGEALPAKKVSRKTSSASDTSEKTTKTQAQTKRGVKNTVSEASKKGAKRTAEPESDSDCNSEGVTPKKKKFNLEKDAVPAAKLGKKKAANKKKQVVSEEAADSESSVQPESTQSPEKSSQSSSNSSFKSPRSVAPKGTASNKGGRVTKSKVAAAEKNKSATPSPSKSSESSSSPVSQPSPKKPAGRKGAAKPSPKPVATATVKVTKNVRRAKPLSNGTTDSDSSGKKTAAALNRAIQKGSLKQETKTSGRGKKK